MSHLRSLQRRFQAYLTESSEAIKKDIVSTPDAPAEHRLGTYFNAYRIRLIDCLAIDYSGLQKYLGDQEVLLILKWINKNSVFFNTKSSHG